MALCKRLYAETARPPRSSFVFLLALITAAFAAAGCASAATPVPIASDPSPTATAKSTPEPTPGAFEEMLGLIPDTPETRAYVRIVDHARLGEALDLPLQSDDSGTGEVELSRAHRTFLSFYNVTLSTQANLREYLALHPENVGQSLLAGVAPHQWKVLRGRFDPDATEQTISTCSGDCIPPDVREEYQGVAFYSWGEDFKGSLRDRLKPPAFDLQGRGGRIAVQDRYVFRTLWTGGMKRLIDASLGRRPSLADAEEFRIPARELSELGVYSVYLSNETRSVSDLDSLTITLTGEPGTYDWLINDDEKLRANKVSFWGSDGGWVGVQLDSPLEEVQQIRQELQQSLLRPYRAFATGRGLDSDGRYIGIVLVHDNEDLAEENAALLQRRIEETLILTNAKPWSETVDVENMEIWTDGRLLVARLPLPRKELNYGIPTFDSAYSLDALLLHE